MFSECPKERRRRLTTEADVRFYAEATQLMCDAK
jgi:hypothetical protein